MLHAMPVLSNGWVLLGELSKWVPAAAARFGELRVRAQGLQLQLHVAAGETVRVSALRPHPRDKAEGEVLEVHATATTAGSQLLCLGICA